MACKYRKTESAETLNITRGLPLSHVIRNLTPFLIRNLTSFLICLAVFVLLSFCWSSNSVAVTSQNDADVSSLDLKWLAASPSLLGFDPVKLETATGNIGKMKGIYSVIVIRNNYLVAERYFREGHRMKPHNLKSATKSVMAALTGIAIEKGYLRLDQPIGDFLPQVKYLEDPRKYDITVLHLLTMTSGLEQTSYQAYNSLARNETDWVWTILNRPLVADPGTKHQYSTGDTHILSAVLTGATGMSTKDFAEKYLFGPLDISIKGWEVDPKGINQGGNNLSLIPLDMALFGQLYLDGGMYRNQQIIPQWWVETSTRPNYLGKHENYGYYSYLWYSRPRGANAFVAVGYGGQYIYVSPEYNCVVVITSTLDSKGKPWEKELFDYIQKGILGSIEPEQQLLQVKYKGKDSPAFYQSGPVSSSADSEEKRKALVIADLNLRKGPSRSSSVIKLLDAGTVLEILEQKDSWYKVQALNLSGWVSAKYVRFINPANIQLAELTPKAARPVRQKVAPKTPATDTRIPQLGEALKQSQRLVAQLQSRLETSQATRQQLEEDLENTKKQLEAKLALERKQRESAEKRLQGAETNRESVSAELEMAKKRIEKQKSTTAGLKAALEKSGLKLAWLQKDLDAKQELVTQSESDRKELESEMAAGRKQLQALEADRQDIAAKLAKVNQGLESQHQATAQAAKTQKQRDLEFAAQQEKLNSIEMELKEARAKGQEFANKLTNVSDTLEKHQQVTAESETARKSLEIDLAKHIEQAVALEKDLDKARSNKTKLQTELAAVQKKMIAKQEAASQLATAKKKLEAELAAEQRKLKKAEDKLLQAQARDLKLEAQVAELNEELEKQKQKYMQTGAGQKSLAAELGNLQNQLVTQTNTLETVRSERDNIQHELAALQKEMTAQQEAANQTISAKTELEAELASRQAQIEELGETQRQFIAQAAKTQKLQGQELASLQKKENELKTALGDALSLTTKRDAELAAVQKELQEQQQVVLQATATQKQLEQELTNEQSNLKNIEAELQKAHASRQGLETRLAEVNLELEKQQRTTGQTKEILKSQETEIAGLHKQIAAQTNTLATIQSKGEPLQEELATLQKELTGQQKKTLLAESANIKLEAELKASNKQVEDLQASMAEAHSLRKDLDGEFANLLKELEAQRQITAQADAAKRNTASQLASANQYKDAADKTILNLERDNKSLEKELAATRNQVAFLEKAAKATPAPAKAPAVQVAKVESPRTPSSPETHKPATQPASTVQVASKTAAITKEAPASIPEEKIMETLVSAVKKPDFNGIDAFVKSWAEAWEQKNVEAYLAHYSKKFHPPRKMSLSAWKKQRHQRLAKPAFIKIEIQDIKQKTIRESSVQAVFIQKYNAGTYSDKVIKTLDLVWEDESWAIAKEASRAL